MPVQDWAMGKEWVQDWEVVLGEGMEPDQDSGVEQEREGVQVGVQVRDQGLEVGQEREEEQVQVLVGEKG